MSRGLVRAYGTRAQALLGDARSAADLGRNFGAGLSEREVSYLMREEWAYNADDVLWRRSKLGLRLSGDDRRALDAFMSTKVDKARAARRANGAHRMSLVLDNISKQVGAETHISRRLTDLEEGFAQRPARADAGRQDLPDAPHGGSRCADERPHPGRDVDVTGVPVQRRNVAMVYQQFINYPSLSVYENIASPLRVMGARAQRA